MSMHPQAITAPSQVLLLGKAKQYNCRTPAMISQTVTLHLISGGCTFMKLRHCYRDLNTGHWTPDDDKRAEPFNNPQIPSATRRTG